MASRKGNESRRSRSWPFVVWNGLLIPLVMRPAHGTCIPRAPLSFLLHLYPPPRGSFPLVLKYLGFMNAAAGCINYTTLFRATATQRPAISRNIMSRFFPFFPCRKTPSIKHDGHRCWISRYWQNLHSLIFQPERHTNLVATMSGRATYLPA